MQINYRNIVLIEKYNMNNKTGFAIAAIAIVAALLVTTSAMNPSNAFAGGHYKKSTTQTLLQQNNCGNGTMPLMHGKFDLLLKIRAKNLIQMREIVENKICKIPHILESELMTVLKTRKEEQMISLESDTEYKEMLSLK